MVHDIYICYAAKESNLARTLCDQAEKAGIKCWIAVRDIPEGGDAKLIAEAIKKARCVVFLLSELSMQSSAVVKQLEFAVRCNSHNILPVLIQDVQLSESFECHLSRQQYIKALDEDIQIRFISTIEALQSFLLGQLPEEFKILNNNLTDSSETELAFEFDLFTLGGMTAKQISEGEPSWIYDIATLEEKDESYVKKILKNSPDKTIFELMPEYCRALHDINYYDTNVTTIKKCYLISGLANLLNLSIEVVKERILNEHANKMVKNLFNEEWPDSDGDDDSVEIPDYLSLGKMKVKDVLNYDYNLIRLISSYARKSETTIKKYLKNASPNETINNAIKDYDYFLDPDILGLSTVAFIRDTSLTSAVVFVINDKKITAQKVEDRLNGERGNKLIKNVFPDVWPN